MKTVIPAEVIDFVKRQKLGFVATVRSDGKPSLSHKGTLTVFDESHLIFADIASPQTVGNLERNPEVVVEVVDYLSRKGYRFRGTARITSLENSAEYISFYEKWGLVDIRNRVKNFVLIEVESYRAVFSPAYSWGATEPELVNKWKVYYNNPWKF